MDAFVELPKVQSYQTAAKLDESWSSYQGEKNAYPVVSILEVFIQQEEEPMFMLDATMDEAPVWRGKDSRISWTNPEGQWTEPEVEWSSSQGW